MLLVTTHSGPAANVVVLALSGTPADDLLSLLVDGVAELTHAGQTVILDLDDMIVTRASTMRMFLERLMSTCASDRVVFRCARRTCRQLLRRWGGDRFTIVDSDDAWLRATRRSSGEVATPRAAS